MGGLELYDVKRDWEGYYNHAADPSHRARLDRLYDHLKLGYPQITPGPR